MRIPLDYTGDGALLVTADEPELLVWDARKDEPLWRHHGEGIAVGVGATERSLVWVDHLARVSFLRRLDGALLEEHPLEERQVRGLWAGFERVAVLGAAAIYLLRMEGLERSFASPDPVSAAWGPQDASLGVVSGSGQFSAIDPASGGAWGSVSLGAPGVDVAWSPRGHWWVAAASELIAVAPDGSAVLQRIPLGEPATAMSLSRDGVVAAVAHPSKRVAIWIVTEGVAAGQITYQRAIGTLRFGPGSWLAVAFEDGEVNRVDVLHGKVTLPQTHVGRRASRWAVDLAVRADLLRGALARAAAGEAPLVTRVKHAWDLPKPKRQISIDSPGGDGCGCWQMVGCFTAILLLGGLLALLAGGYLWYFGGLGPLARFIPL